jgi:thiosulfate/3-mercaptopyruvate sulfurtransferase
MNKKLFFIFGRCGLPLFILFSLGNPAYTKPPYSPIVSGDWLTSYSDMNNLVIVDIRTSNEYAAGHILNSINIPFEMPVSAWIIMKDDLLLEVPEKEDLFNTLGAYGITRHSIVVVVTSGPAEPPYPLADATRVADTLIYSGLKAVSILDGGYAKWVDEGRPTTTEIPVIHPVNYHGRVKKKMFVSIDYVKKLTEQNQSKSILIDARDANVYDGSVIEPHADKAGHIPTAKSLPTVLIWNKDGTYKSKQELKDLAEAVVGNNKRREIVVYCGLGGYASSWWFVLTQVLDYKNVMIYDGAAQEWARYYDMVLD